MLLSLHPCLLNGKAKDNNQIMNTHTFEFHERLTDSMTMMMKYAYRFTTDDDKAKELLQETMLKVLQNNEKYLVDDNFQGWLRTIMHNTYLNMLRSRVVYLDERKFSATFAGRSSYFDTAFDYNELRRLVATLPCELHVPFMLHVKGFKYEEITLMLDLPLGTVKSRIFTARERLKAMLEEG